MGKLSAKRSRVGWVWILVVCWPLLAGSESPTQNKKGPPSLVEIVGTWRQAKTLAPGPGWDGEAVMLLSQKALTLYSNPQVWIRAGIHCWSERDALICAAADGIESQVKFEWQRSLLHMAIKAPPGRSKLPDGFVSYALWERLKDEAVQRTIEGLPSGYAVCDQTRRCIGQALKRLKDHHGLDEVKFHKPPIPAGCYAVRKLTVEYLRAEKAEIPKDCLPPPGS